MSLLDYGPGRLISRFPIWVTQARTVLRREGFIGLLRRSLKKIYRYVVYKKDPHRFHRIQYREWRKNIESKYLNDTYAKELFKRIEKKPMISVLFPVWNKPLELVQQSLESVLSQYYENWELCISDGSSENVEEITEFLKSFQKKYRDRVSLRFLSEELRKKINIVENRNNCLDMAKGEYCVVLDCDDMLSRNCLLELAWEIQSSPTAAFIYSDFDKIDLDNERYDPSFWPDWSPHTLLSMMYTTHVRCFDTQVLRSIEGFREGTEGADDLDVVLRISEVVSPHQIRHVPKILYHWRLHSGSTSVGAGAKGWAYENQRKVLEDWVARNREKAVVEEGSVLGWWRVRFQIIKNPKVVVIIPFKDEVRFTKECIESINQKTRYKNYEVVLVDNRSEEKETLDYLDSIRGKCSVLRYDKPYSFGKINNWAVQRVDGEHILFLNNDAVVRSEGWMESLLEYSQKENIGAVGAKLLYPDGRIQHAGVVVGLVGAAAHSHRLLPGSTFGYNGWVVTVRDVMAVTAACMMIKKGLFLEMGGFSPEFDPAYQDVDLCIRLFEKGYWNIYTPYSELIHHESVTRLNKKNQGALESDEENAVKLRNRWPQYLGVHFCNDPFYNPNLTDSHEDFRLKNTWYPEEWGKKIGLVID